MSKGCIKEDCTHYHGPEVLKVVTVDTAQACAERCASSEKGLFWTFDNPGYSTRKMCQVFSSISGRGSSSGGCGVSGSRQCGLFTMGGSKSLSLKVQRVFENLIVKNCSELPLPCTEKSTLDSTCSSTDFQICLQGQCTNCPVSAPWGALDFGNRTQVNKK